MTDLKTLITCLDTKVYKALKSIILQAALSPLGSWTVLAASPLTSWLSRQDIARIWLVKANTPKAVPAAQILQQPDQTTSTCEQDDIADSADTPAQSTKLSFLSTRPQRIAQNNLPTIRHARGG